MKIEIPEITDILNTMLEEETKYDNEKLKIREWVERQNNEIKRNKELVSSNKSEDNIKAFIKFLTPLLIRAIRGESGEKISKELEYQIRTDQDLNERKFKKALENYRWGTNVGVGVIKGVLKVFKNGNKWVMVDYLKKSEREYKNNFINDEILEIKYVGYKVRDLALSIFNPYYIAFDRHVVRVISRTGLLNFGYEFVSEKTDLGTDPSKEENYLFLHKLIGKLSEQTNGKFKPVDIDRSFWHFGRTVCKKVPECLDCPLHEICLTGKEVNQ